MASVSNLDQDVKNLRLSRYTPAAANETRAWIEETLGEKLAPGDLLDALKDGVALCKLAKLALPPPGFKFKQSNMPFVQMENISHFLRACEAPPLSLPAHDRFLTVDLYESKDPAQVLQCLGAFSRVANRTNPSRFPTTIGPRQAVGGAMAPNMTGGSNGLNARSSPARNGYPGSTAPTTARALTPSLTGGSNASSSRGATHSPSASVTSWSKKSDHGSTAPAWNIAQYGYMGGASQGNQGIAFGARRQITSTAPHVPSLAEKERRRREAEDEEQKRRSEQAAGEERARAEEERRWEEETLHAREQERLAVEKQKREWEEEERRWREAEQQRQQEERTEAEKLQRDQTQTRSRADSSSILRGQTLSEYQREARSRVGSRQVSSNHPSDNRNAESDRVRELELQLEEAKRREAEYEKEREERLHNNADRNKLSTSVSESENNHVMEDDQGAQPSSPQESQASWVSGNEREHTRQQHPQSGVSSGTRPLPNPLPTPYRPLPIPAAAKEPRPLPVPQTSNSTAGAQPNRTDRFLAANAAPTAAKPSVTTAPEQSMSTSGEQAEETSRRLLSQQKTKAGGWASKSLLEREMERERERQREWEEAQKESAGKAKDDKQVVGPAGETWDAHQYGYLGGDSQNKGAQGIGFGSRRQIIGPRPQR